MKSGWLILGLILFFCLAANLAGHSVGGIPIAYSNEERLIKVMDFPRTHDFISADGEPVDLGYKYTQLSLFGIPLWNYDQQWCGFIDDEYYLEIPEPSLREILQARQIFLPDPPKLSAWESWGGKLLVVGMLVWVLRLLKAEFTKRRPGSIDSRSVENRPDQTD